MCMKRASRYTKKQAIEDDIAEDFEDEMESLEEDEDYDDGDYYDDGFDEDFNDDSCYDHDTYDDDSYDDSWYYPDDDGGRNPYGHRDTIVINHSSFSNAQSTYDEDVVAGCWVSQVDINLVSQVGQGKITDAIHVQDDVIKKILDRCDEYTELIYYGITHIPFIFRAGFQIGNEGKVRLLHKYRNEQACFKELSSEPDNYKIQLKDTEVVNRGNGANEMLVVIETSFSVKDEDLSVFQDKAIGYDMHFELGNDSM